MSAVPVPTAGRAEASPRSPELRAGVAVSIGILALLSALAVGHLLAAFVGSAASPYFAVGNAAVDLTPARIKDWAVNTFGTADKVALLVGMGTVLVLLAVAAGLLSRRYRYPGSALVTVLGIVGIAAVVSRTDLGKLALLAPMASLLAGLAVFNWLHVLAVRTTTDGVPGSAPGEPHTTGAGDADPGATGSGTTTSAGVGATGPDITVSGVPGSGDDGVAARGTAAGGTGRRQFLLTAGGIGIGAGLAGLGGEVLGGATAARRSRAAITGLRAAEPAPPIPPGADFSRRGTPSFLTRSDAFYRIDTALVVPEVRTRDWSLRIHGMVDREITFTYADIRSRPLVERTLTLCCVSNPVGGSYISTANFLGLDLADLLAEVGVHEGAQQLFSTSADGWTCGTPVAAVTDRDRGAMLAIGMNGEPLPLEHGFPARMVVPGLYGYVSATKWVVDMEITTWDARSAYWIERSWAREAPVKTQSRIDTPSDSGEVERGTVPVAGIAWAQTRGIARVQVRLDDGPWRDTRLGADVSDDTWRMWRLDLDVPDSGEHRLACRAIDKTGAVQTGEPAPVLPDGATGWHTVRFRAR